MTVVARETISKKSAADAVSRAVRARFAAAHDKFVKSLLAEAQSRVFAGSGDTAGTT